jgi:hypothetical protein
MNDSDSFIRTIATELLSLFPINNRSDPTLSDFTSASTSFLIPHPIESLDDEDYQSRQDSLSLNHAFSSSLSANPWRASSNPTYVHTRSLSFSFTAPTFETSRPQMYELFDQEPTSYGAWIGIGVAVIGFLAITLFDTWCLLWMSRDRVGISADDVMNAELETDGNETNDLATDFTDYSFGMFGGKTDEGLWADAMVNFNDADLEEMAF